MQANELCKALRRSGTGSAKVELLEKIQQEHGKKNMPAEQLLELALMHPDNKEGRLDGTIAKARLMLEGKFDMPVPPKRVAGQNDPETGEPGTRLTSRQIDEVRRERVTRQFRREEFGTDEPTARERDPYPTAKPTVEGPEWRENPPPGLTRSDSPEPYGRPSVESEDFVAEDKGKKERPAPALVPAEKYLDDQVREMARTETTVKDHKKAEAEGDPTQADPKKAEEMRARVVGEPDKKPAKAEGKAK